MVPEPDRHGVAFRGRPLGLGAAASVPAVDFASESSWSSTAASHELERAPEPTGGAPCCPSASHAGCQL